MQGEKMKAEINQRNEEAKIKFRRKKKHGIYQWSGAVCWH